MATNLYEFVDRAARRLHGSSRLPGEASGRLIEAGDFIIDLDRFTVAVRGHDLRLTIAEFDLLVFLVSHRKKVVTPRTILLTRWSPSEVHEEDFLPVLQSLRKKIEAEIPDQHYIRTEPWLLCRFEPSAP